MRWNPFRPREDEKFALAVVQMHLEKHPLPEWAKFWILAEHDDGSQALARLDNRGRIVETKPLPGGKG